MYRVREHNNNTSRNRKSKIQRCRVFNRNILRPDVSSLMSRGTRSRSLLVTCSPLKFASVRYFPPYDQVDDCPSHYHQVEDSHSYQAGACCPSHYRVEDCPSRYQHHPQQQQQLSSFVSAITTTKNKTLPEDASLQLDPLYPHLLVVKVRQSAAAAVVDPSCRRLHAVTTGQARRLPLLVMLVLPNLMLSAS